MNQTSQLDAAQTANLRQAFAFAEQGKLEQASRTVDALLAEHSDHPQALMLRGLIAADEGRMEHALADLARAQSALPDEPTLCFNHANILQRTGRFAQALALYQKVLKVNPKAVPALVNAAYCAEGSGDASLARELGERAMRLKPYDSKIFLAQVNRLRRMNDVDAAMALLERHPPEMEQSTLNGIRARLVWDQGDLEQAEALFAQAKDHNVIAVQHAWLLQSMQREQEARERLRQWLRDNDDDQLVRYNLAALLSRAGDSRSLKESRTILDVLLPQREQDPAVHNTLGLVRMKLGDDDGAEQALREAARLAPGNPEYAENLGDLLARRQRYADAISVYEPILSRRPDHPTLLRQRGIARLQSGDAKAAERDLMACLHQRPNDQRAIAFRALSMQKDGRSALEYLDTERVISDQTLSLPDSAPFASLEAFNAALAEEIANHSTLIHEPVGLAARKGAMTRDLLADGGPAITAFHEALQASIRRFIDSLAPQPDHPFLHAIPQDFRLNLWATYIDQPGGVIDSHNHEESWLSGAYYVSLPMQDDDGQEGWLEFGAPPPSVEMDVADSELLHFQPREGRLLFFPSYLYHRTLPFSRPGRRISISFDLVGQSWRR